MTSTDGQPDPADSPFPALLDQVKRITLTKLHERLAQDGFDGIAFRHGHVLRFIDESGARVTDLSARAGVTKQAIGDLVSELERMGYVERVPDQRDRRAKTVRLTSRGTAAQSAGRRILADIDAEWRTCLGDEALTGLRETLERIVRLGHC
jgi:DNA-binding MarR family transcriptional regulator